MTFAVPSFTAGLVLSMSLIMAIGPQNAHVLRMGLQRQHIGLTVVVCMLSDMALIGLGVYGLAQLGGLSGRLLAVLVGAGVLFLAVSGWKAFRRFLHPQPAVPGGDSGRLAAQSLTRRQAVGAALAFSWLNPHAWLDTAVLIGTASLAHGAGAGVFGLGAAAGSVVWFAVWGLATYWLGRRLETPHLYRLLDGLVALMMWGTAGWLVCSLS